MVELPPIRGDHIGGYMELRRVFELPHDFPAAEARFRPAGILHIGNDPMHVPAQVDRFLQALAAFPDASRMSHISSRPRKRHGLIQTLPAVFNRS